MLGQDWEYGDDPKGWCVFYVCSISYGCAYQLVGCLQVAPTKVDNRKI